MLVTHERENSAHAAWLLRAVCAPSAVEARSPQTPDAAAKSEPSAAALTMLWAQPRGAAPSAAVRAVRTDKAALACWCTK
eukprot:6188992-Pleurochrysis_carterae.AAC.2